MSDLEIRSSDRCCFFGRTGSGKTTLAKALLRLSARYVVLDPKHTYRTTGLKPRSSYSTKDTRQIVRVPFDGEAEAWWAVLGAAWKQRNTLIYVDELTLVNTSRTAVHPMLGRVIRTGRERNVGVWLGSQRPKDIPSAVFTEAEHFFIFQLQWEDDRDKVASFTSDAVGELLPTLRGHEFVYYSVRDDKAEKRLLSVRKPAAIASKSKV